MKSIVLIEDDDPICGKLRIWTARVLAEELPISHFVQRDPFLALQLPHLDYALLLVRSRTSDETRSINECILY